MSNAQICNKYVDQIQQYYKNVTDINQSSQLQPVAGRIVTYMDAHLQFDGLMYAMDAFNNPKSVIPDFARGVWEYTVPDGKLIVGLKGQTIKNLTRKIMGQYDNWDMLYQINGVYTVDAKNICDPTPTYQHIGEATWDTPPSWKNGTQSFDISFTDIYAGFFLCGFWFEVNSLFTGIVEPGKCMFPCITYCGMIIRHYATGEERLYDIVGIRKCGMSGFYPPLVIKTYRHFDAISYIKINLTMAYETPLCEITKVGQRNMQRNFPPKDPSIHTPEISPPVIAANCYAPSNFGAYQPIPKCQSLDAAWSKWSQYGPCINGQQSRARLCKLPYGCDGPTVQTRSCSTSDDTQSSNPGNTNNTQSDDTQWSLSRIKKFIVLLSILVIIYLLFDDIDSPDDQDINPNVLNDDI